MAITLFPAPLAGALAGIQEDQHSLSLYVEQMVRRIDHYDGELQAFLPEPSRHARLRTEIGLLREQFPDRESLPPLIGAMVGVKDIFHVNGFVTHAGSALPPELFAGPEAEVVTLLRDAGALIAGKTVTTEFAFVEPGPTRNPHNLDHSPGGSSSGSAAAVAAGMCNLALGTQTIGSTIRPAAFCGIVGYKPTVGRIPTAGLVFFSRTIDTVGLFTQDVEGMARAAAVVCRNWSTELAPPRELPVLGVPDGPFLAQTEPEALEIFEEILLMLQVAGCQVKRVEAFPDIDDLNTRHRRLVFAEFAREHAEFSQRYEALYRPRTAEALHTGQSVGDDELAELRKGPAALRDQLAQQMDREGIDLWVCPSASGPAPKDLSNTGGSNMNLPWSHAGMPALSIPAGRAANGLPLGLQLVGRMGQDEHLLQLAALVTARVPEPVDMEG